MGGVSIQNLTRRRTAPRTVFSRLAAHILPHWEISLVFVTPAKARTLNKKLRHKVYVPNVLSYTVGPQSGEIIICLAEADTQAPSYGLSPIAFHVYLFIHGALHLKGWVHSATMEKCEQELLTRFLPARQVGAQNLARTNSHGTKNRNRHRHRHLSGKSSRRRRTLR